MITGGDFRDRDLTNPGKGILESNENFETDAIRKVLGIIDIRDGDLLISGSGGFTEYTSWGCRGKSMLIDMEEIERLTYV